MEYKSEMTEATSLDKLIPDPFGLRVRYDDKVVINLGGSILQNGIITPLLVRPKNGKYEIIDGNYRYKALEYIKWEKHVPINSKEMTDEEALLRAVISNWHRRNFRFGDKANSVKKLKDKGFTTEQVCMKLEIKPKTIYNYYSPYINDIPDEVKDIMSPAGDVTKRHVSALIKLKEHPDKQRELAERIVTEKLDGATAEREVEKMLKPPKPEPEFKPNLYNVWNFSKCDERFGREGYPGRIPGQIVQNVLCYYTEEGDLVVDPMAGSGTIKDVCNLMKRKCKSYDNNPKSFEVDDDIDYHDIREGFPEEVKGCDLIFLDPPYWRLRKEDYGKESVSEFETYEEWLDFMGKLAKGCHETVKLGGYVALLTMAFLDEENERFLDLPFDCTRLFLFAGFEEVYRVSVPLNSEVKSDLDVARYKEKKIMLDLNRDLIIFRKSG